MPVKPDVKLATPRTISTPPKKPIYSFCIPPDGSVKRVDNDTLLQLIQESNKAGLMQFPHMKWWNFFFGASPQK